MFVVDIAIDPIIAQVGPLQLAWHGVFTALAVALAVWFGLRLGEQRGMPREALGDVATWGIVGGVVGARLLHVMDHLSVYLANPVAVLFVWQGGMAVYGAFLGGIAAALLAARRAGLAGWTLLDAAAPAMVLGQVVGRLGCLVNGDAWGAPCSSGAVLCVRYVHPNALLPADLLGVPTHPYPLYEMAAGALLLAALHLARRRLTAPGTLVLVAAVGYAAIRFSLSFFRQETVVVAGLQEAQVVALAAGVVALALLLARGRPTSTAPSAGEGRAG
ncbi:MAG TPA: prolipoprotein diacylglyceryl transferase [Chloroflexota bacterium]